MIEIISSVNHRLFNSKFQKIYGEMLKGHKSIFCHENSFELKKYGLSIDFKNTDNIRLFDLFEFDPSLESFINSWPASKEYWNANAKYWYRKIVSLKLALKYSLAEIIIWSDCDIYFKKPFDQVFMDHIRKYDICSIKRKDLHTETGFISFKKSNAESFINKLSQLYTSRRIFQETRWDDCWAFDLISKEENLNYGYLTTEFGCPFNISDYVHHYKGPLISIRSKEPPLK